MRLFEISSPTKDQFTPKVSDDGDRYNAVGELGGWSGGQEEIGSGMYAIAFSSKEEPGTVRKIAASIDNLDHDAYFQYVKMITENDRMSGNPYFPKVFNLEVKQYWRTSPEGERIGKEFAYAADLERLLPFASLSSREAKMLGDKMFYDFAKKHKPGRIISGAAKKIDYRWELSGRIEDTFSDDVYNSSPSKLATIVKDRYYKQAVLLIKGMIKGNDHMQEDMHDENIMLRRGPGGPQIVITDPVQSGG